MLWQFGFGQPTGFDVTDVLSGLMPSHAWKKRNKKESWYPGDTVNTGIGQGFTLVTPLQLAVAVAALAKQGQRFSPHFLLRTESPQGDLSVKKPHLLSEIKLPQGDWQIVEEGMRRVMGPGGTGYHYGAGANYAIAGKTGTAQVFSLKGEKYNKNKVPE
jgi:penicillin-binding protein 2